MKSLSAILLVLFSAVIYAQDDAVVMQDSLVDSDSNSFIEDHKNQLNIKFDISNDIPKYFITFDDQKVGIKPNLNLRYALDFNHKFASVRLGIRAPVSDAEKEEKGDSYVLNLRVKLLFEKWAHKFEYLYVRGYHIDNSENLTENDIQYQIQFPRLKTNIYKGSTAYKFNENFSLRAVASQTEIQTKSAGSFMPSIDYWLYTIRGTDEIINVLGEPDKRDTYNNFKGFTTVLNAGYYYTYVYKKYWYAHAYLSPGLGADFYTIESYSPDQNTNQNQTNFVVSLKSGIAVGYNSQKYYFGLAYNNRSTKENPYTDTFEFHSSRNIFHAFIGYRFKAPKPVAETIEYLEKKVPILDKDVK
ncbi:MAG: DUF4421 domain-containing protein [Flavobacteriaceae bacterium]|nr:DUF4421 domain-containing protein [Flavobacteriaceae bacterium]